MHLLDSLNDLVLLLLLLLVLLKKINLLEVVLEALQVVEIEEMNDEEEDHDWAHANLVLVLLGHHGLGLLVSNSHENVNELGAELLRHEVSEHENKEHGEDLSDDPAEASAVLESGNSLASHTSAENGEEDHERQDADVLEQVDEKELVSRHEVWLLWIDWLWFAVLGHVAVLVAAPWQLLVINNELSPFVRAKVAVGALDETEHTGNNEEDAGAFDALAMSLFLLLCIGELDLGWVLGNWDRHWSNHHWLNEVLHFFEKYVYRNYILDRRVSKIHKLFKLKMHLCAYRFKHNCAHRMVKLTTIINEKFNYQAF